MGCRRRSFFCLPANNHGKEQRGETSEHNQRTNQFEFQSWTPFQSRTLRTGWRPSAASCVGEFGRNDTTDCSAALPRSLGTWGLALGRSFLRGQKCL